MYKTYNLTAVGVRRKQGAMDIPTISTTLWWQRLYSRQVHSNNKCPACSIVTAWRMPAGC